MISCKPVQQNNHDKTATFRLSPLTLLAGFAVVLVVFSAYARHIGFNPDWNEGFHHPLEGWDHLLTMITVGIWAAQLRGHAIWLLPLAFVGVMSAGGLAGAAGFSIPSVEGLIFLSCAVFSVLIVCRTRFSTQVNVMIVAFFAFFHGFAHGQEISASASLVSYTFGFVLATLLLHGAGIIVAKLVVLCAASLIAMFISGMANANTTGLTVSGKSLNDRFKLTEDRFEHQDHPDFVGRHRLDQAYSAYNYINGLTHPDSEGIARKNSSEGDALPPLIPINKRTSCQPSSGMDSQSSVKTELLAQCLTSSSSQFEVGDHGLLMHFCNLYPDNGNLKRIAFKYFFPDINHSPGKTLLSGGKGLTSPPTVQTIFAQPRFYPLTPSSQRFKIEESPLQLPSAGISSGKIDCNNPIVTLGLGIFRRFNLPESAYSSATSLAKPHDPCGFPAQYSGFYKFGAALHINTHAAANPIRIQTDKTTFRSEPVPFFLT